MSFSADLRAAFDTGAGILRLAPCWVPRTILMPGGRLKLDPRDLYAYGPHRGGINERWLSSTTHADNGPDTPADEGISYIVSSAGGQTPKKMLLTEAIEELGAEILGTDVMAQYGGWIGLCKLFDNTGPIPLHIHQMEEHAAKVNTRTKPEAHYFPPQCNSRPNSFPFTFMGLDPGTTKDDVRACLERWNEGDNGILYHSKAYKLKPGSGWHVPAGVLHAPGSLVTYEPQLSSEVLSMFQSMVDGVAVPRDLLVKDVPPAHHQDLDYIIGMLDWEANLDPEFIHRHRCDPMPVSDLAEMRKAGYQENWISYGSNDFSAKELTVFPGRTATIRDAAAYGLILTQGRGQIGRFDVETPTMIRFGELTKDELFVSVTAARGGVSISNQSDTENLVLLKHFGPGNPDAQPLIRL